MNVRTSAPRLKTALLSMIALFVIASCSAPAGAPGSVGGQPERPPNIVLIMADDLGYGDIEPYGQTKIRTPHLARMAREGLRFTQFYAGSTVCAPSRAVLMTGLHTGHAPIRGNKEYPLGQEPLPADFTTLAELLKGEGYVTGTFGKWGLGGPGTEGAPERQGVDEFFGYLDQKRAHHFYPEWLYRNGERVTLPGNRVHARPDNYGSDWVEERGQYSHDAIAAEALDFIDEHQGSPFFLYLPFTIPHAELEAPEDAFAPYLDANARSIFPETPFAGNGYGPQPIPHAAYAAMITRMDRDVGRVLEKLQRLGLDDNTIVLFTSDNGPSVEGGSDPEFFDSSGPLRGVKRDLYEGGIRVPMIVRAPGLVPAGQTSDHVWTMWDILPTLATLAGAPSPSGIDGLDMVNALTGEGASPQHESLYWEFHERGGKQAVRKDNWKAVRLDVVRDPNGPIELYDLDQDLGETRDVAAQHPQIVREMAAIMAREHTPSAIFPALDGAR